MNTLLKTFGFVAASASLALTAAPAMASAIERKTATVETVDLNLDTPAGQRALEKRIHKAAEKVCYLNEARSQNRMRFNQARACYRKAKAGANKQVAKINEDIRVGG